MKLLMGKSKFKEKNRGVRREMEAREGLFRCWLLTYSQTQTAWLEALLRGPSVFEFFPAQTSESLKTSSVLVSGSHLTLRGARQRDQLGR